MFILTPPPPLRLSHSVRQPQAEVPEPNDVLCPLTMNVTHDEEIKAKITPWLKANGIKLEDQGCKPLFLVLRLGHCVGAVNGCNSADYRMLIDLNLPKRKKKEKK